MEYKEYEDVVAEMPQLYEAIHAKSYVILGLAGEVSELYEKLVQSDTNEHFPMEIEERDGIEKELGDCLWYMAMTRRLFEFNLPDSFVFPQSTNPCPENKRLTISLIVTCGRIVEHMKKAIRDTKANIDPQRKVAMTELWMRMMELLCEISHYVGTRLTKIADKNVHKLNSRQDRRVLKGEGDNR